MKQANKNIYSPDACQMKKFKGLIKACRKGDMLSVMQLVDVAGPLDRCVDDWSPLAMACANRHHAIASLLLEKGANSDFGIGDKTPLIEAILAHDFSMVSLLLKAGASPNAAGAKEAVAEPTKLPSWQDQFDAVDSDEDPNLYIEEDPPRVPIGCALGEEQWDIAIELLRCGARLDVYGSGGMSIMGQVVLCECEDLFDEICRVPNWFNIPAFQGFPLLNWAARWGRSKYAIEAVKNGVNPNVYSIHDTTALHDACIGGDVETVKGLLELGASPNIGLDYNYSPFHAAVSEGNVDAAVAIMMHWGIRVHEDVQGRPLQQWFRKNPEALIRVQELIASSVQHVVSAVTEPFDSLVTTTLPKVASTSGGRQML